MNTRRAFKVAKRTPPHRRRERGIFLLEAIAYVAILAIILALALEAFYAAHENNRNLTRNADDIVRALKAGERWRADVRTAAGPARLIGDETRGEFHLPQKQGEVVYTTREGSVFRREPGNDNDVLFLADVKRSNLVRDRRQHVAAWRWEVELQGRQKVVRVRPLFTFLAPEPVLQKP